jgi:hypothetical protein
MKKKRKFLSDEFDRYCYVVFNTYGINRFVIYFVVSYNRQNGFSS